MDPQPMLPLPVEAITGILQRCGDHLKELTLSGFVVDTYSEARELVSALRPLKVLEKLSLYLSSGEAWMLNPGIRVLWSHTAKDNKKTLLPHLKSLFYRGPFIREDYEPLEEMLQYRWNLKKRGTVHLEEVIVERTNSDWANPSGYKIDYYDINRKIDELIEDGMVVEVRYKEVDLDVFRKEGYVERGEDAYWLD